MTNRIIMLNRNHSMWKQPMRLSSLNGEVLAVIPKPANTIICDGCNSIITTEYIGCLSFKKGYIHSAQCQDCIKEFFSTFRIIEQKDSEWNE